MSSCNFYHQLTLAVNLSHTHAVSVQPGTGSTPTDDTRAVLHWVQLVSSAGDHALATTTAITFASHRMSATRTHGMPSCTTGRVALMPLAGQRLQPNLCLFERLIENL